MSANVETMFYAREAPQLYLRVWGGRLWKSPA